MSRLDSAAKAFREADASYHIESVGNGGYEVRDGHNRPITDPSDHQTALIARNQIAGKAGAAAALREMISPTIISEAATLAAVDIRKYGNTRLNLGRSPANALISGLVEALKREVRNGQSELAATSDRLSRLMEDAQPDTTAAEETKDGFTTPTMKQIVTDALEKEYGKLDDMLPWGPDSPGYPKRPADFRLPKGGAMLRNGQFSVHPTRWSHSDISEMHYDYDVVAYFAQEPKA